MAIVKVSSGTKGYTTKLKLELFLTAVLPLPSS